MSTEDMPIEDTPVQVDAPKPESPLVTALSQNSYAVKLGLTCAAVLLMLVICGIGIVGYNKYQEHQAEQVAIQKAKAHAVAQANIRELIDVCKFQRIDEKEQASIDACGDDVDKARRAIRNVIDDRIVYWESRCANIVERVNKLKGIKDNANSWTYSDEHMYREIGSKIVDEAKTAGSQLDFWKLTRNKLDNYTLGSKKDEMKPKASV